MAPQLTKPLAYRSLSPISTDCYERSRVTWDAWTGRVWGGGQSSSPWWCLWANPWAGARKENLQINASLALRAGGQSWRTRNGDQQRYMLGSWALPASSQSLILTDGKLSWDVEVAWVPVEDLSDVKAAKMWSMWRMWGMWMIWWGRTSWIMRTAILYIFQLGAYQYWWFTQAQWMGS